MGKIAVLFLDFCTESPAILPTLSHTDRSDSVGDAPTGSCVDATQVHGAVSPDSVYVTPTGRVWLLGWPWAVARSDIPAGLRPDPLWTPNPAEWVAGQWNPLLSASNSIMYQMDAFGNIQPLFEYTAAFETSFAKHYKHYM